MNLLPITLGIARPIISGDAAKDKGRGGSSDPASSLPAKIPTDLKQKIFDRDKNTCRYCGFEAKKYQEIHFLNQNPQDLNPKNLVTACIFCHQCFNLQDINHMKSGVLLWLPEIDQAALHHMARAIYVARISQGPMAEAARKALDTLMARREEAVRRISTDNPYILTTVMQDYLGGGHYKNREKKLKGIKLFPLDRRLIKEADLEFNQFPQILAYWRSKDGPFGGNAPPTWISLYKEIAQAA